MVVAIESLGRALAANGLAIVFRPESGNRIASIDFRFN